MLDKAVKMPLGRDTSIPCRNSWAGVLVFIPHPEPCECVFWEVTEMTQTHGPGQAFGKSGFSSECLVST